MWFLLAPPQQRKDSLRRRADFISFQSQAIEEESTIFKEFALSGNAVTVNVGLFINTVISFLIVAFAMFLVIRGMNMMKQESPAPAAAPTTKECPFCCTSIPIKAKRCPNWTSPFQRACEVLLDTD